MSFGTIKAVDHDKQIAFILPDDRTADVFLPPPLFREMDDMRRGMRVEYSATMTEKGARATAVAAA